MTDTPNTSTPANRGEQHTSAADYTARLVSVLIVVIIGAMVLFSRPSEWNTPFLIVIGILAGLAAVVNVLARFRR